MRRNRKHQSAAIRFVPALNAALICLFIGGSAIGYVWQRNVLHDLGQKIREKENRLAQMRQANEKLSKQLITLRSPAYLARRMKELNLQLIQPNQSQILRLQETPLGEWAPRNSPLLADRSTGLALGQK